MKRLVLFLASVFAIHAVMAADSYLYWMVDDSRAAGKEWDSAKIHYTDLGSTPSDGYLGIYGDIGGGYIGDSVSYAQVGNAKEFGAGLWAKLLAGSSATYVIELWKGDVAVAQSTSYAYSELANYIASAGISAPGGGMLKAMPMPAPVPEPTSGLLVLLGCAGLALRRRRPVKA